MQERVIRYHWIICTKLMYYHQECYDEWIKYCVSLVFICPLLFNCDITVASSSVFLRGQMVGTSVLAALAGHFFCKAEKINPISATAATMASHQSLGSMHKIHKTAVAHIKIRWVSSLRPKLNIVGVSFNQNPKFTDSLEVLKWLFPIMQILIVLTVEIQRLKQHTLMAVHTYFMFWRIGGWFAWSHLYVYIQFCVRHTDS